MATKTDLMGAPDQALGSVPREALDLLNAVEEFCGGRSDLEMEWIAASHDVFGRMWDAVHSAQRNLDEATGYLDRAGQGSRTPSVNTAAERGES